MCLCSAAKVSNESDGITGIDQSRSSQSVHHQDNAAVKKAPSGSYLNSASPPFIPSGVLQQKLAGRMDGSDEPAGSSGQIQSKGREQYGAGARNSSRTNFDTGGVSKSASGSVRGSTSGGQSSGHGWGHGDGLLPQNFPQQGARPTSSSANQHQKQNLHNVSNPVADPSANQSGRVIASQAQTAGFVRTPLAQGQTQQSQQGQATTSNPRSLQPGSGIAGNNSVAGSNNTRYKGSGGGRGSRGGSVPVTGRGSYIYGGAPNAGVRVGDSGFQPSPAVGPGTCL